MTVKRIFIILGTVLYAAFLLYVLWLPKDSLPVHRILSPDKLYHAGSYLVLMALTLVSFRSFDLMTQKLVRWSFSLVFLHASASEYFQQYAPGRSAGWDDWIANCLGILLAYSLFKLLDKKRIGH